MISWFVRRVVEQGYRKQNRGNFEGLTKMLAEDGLFELVGDTPSGGEPRSKVREDRLLADLGVVRQALDLIEDHRVEPADALALETPAVRVHRQGMVDR